MKVTLLGTSHGNPTTTRCQSSSLIEVKDQKYLVDAGDSAITNLIRREIKPAEISAVFITHMHLDHTGGLPAFMSQAYKYNKSRSLPILLPEAEAEAPLRQWVKVNMEDDSVFRDIRAYEAGKIYEDDFIKVEAFPTKHMVWSTGRPDAKSYGFRITAEGKKVFFTGDLVGDFSDFPFDAAEGCDILISELVHFKPESALPRLKELKVGRLIFNHIGDPWQTKDGRKYALDTFSALDYPVTLSYDGYVFEI